MLHYFLWIFFFWFLSGILSAIPYFYFVVKKFTVADIFGVFLMGFMGAFALIINLIELSHVTPDTVLWERKDTKEKDDY